MILDPQLAFRVQHRGKGDGKRRNAAIEEKFFLLFAYWGLHSDRRRRSHASCEIVIVPVFAREIRSPIWRKRDRIPSDISAGACLENWVMKVRRGLDAAGVRI